MNRILLGNFVALIASLVMVYSGFLKNKKRILFFQTLQIGMSIISNVIIGGISGIIINSLSCVRNILCYKNKLGIKEKIIISLLAIILSLKFNNIGIVGILPLISSVTYIWLMDIKDVKKFKILIIFTMLLWFVYDISIKLFVSALFDLATASTNCFSIFLLNKEKTHKD